MIIGLRQTKKDALFEERLQLLKTNRNVEYRFYYEDTVSDYKDLDILITNKLTKDELAKAINLKVLFITFTGVNALPMDELIKRNITVVNTHAHAPFVAERAVSLALVLLGRVAELHNHLQIGHWVGYDNTATWISMRDKRCGLIGFGEIGSQIVKLLLPYNVQIITLERYQDNAPANTIFYSDIGKVCENSDVIFVSLPLTDSTKNIIDEKVLEMMKGKYLINVGRGDIIKEEALYNALKNNIIKGAAIDVWYNYPKEAKGDCLPSNYPLSTLPNVLLSPHCAGNTADTRIYVNKDILANLEHFFTNGYFKNIVDLTKRY